MKKTVPDNFPKTAADWERVIAAAPGEDRPLPPEEEAAMQRSVVVHSGGFVAVREALAKRRRELERKLPAKHVTRHLEQDVLAEHMPG